MFKLTLRGPACAAALLLLGAGTALAAGQGRSQQRCINKINKAAMRVHEAQSKVNTDCVKGYLRGGVESAEDCILSDAKNKVADNQIKLVRDDDRSCDLPLPGFAYNPNALYVGTTAAQAAIDLAHDVFGDPVDDGLAADCEDEPEECLCQRQTINRIARMSRAVGKIWLKCKKEALAWGELLQFPFGAQNIGELQRCVTDKSLSLSVEKRIDAEALDLANTVGQFCDESAFDGGVCVGLPAGTAAAECIEERIKCHFCRMVNRVDVMNVDCAAWSGAASAARSCP